MAVTAQERPIPTGEGLTFEKVWAMFQASREEADRQRKETERMFQETARQMEKTDRQMQETDKKIEALNKQMGGLHNSFGELAEHLVAPGIEEKFNALGYHFDGIAPRGYKIGDGHGKIIAEIDILLENGDFIVAVEVKTEPKDKDIERHVKRLQILREHRDKKNDKRKIRGAIAAAIISNELKQAALEAGLYVLVQSGDTMKMDIPDDFVPQEW